MPVWPGSLMQYAISDGYEETWAESATRQTMSVGRKARLRDTCTVKLYTVSVALATESKPTLFTFWRDTLQNGILAFDWTRFDDPTIANSYKMLQDPDFQPFNAGTWKATMKLSDANPTTPTFAAPVSTPSSWPSTLPQYATVAGFREMWNGFSLRSGISQGTSGRSRSSFTEKRLSLSFTMDLTQKKTFEDFYLATLVLGSRPFRHTGFTDDGSAQNYLLIVPPKFVSLGGKLFTLSIEVVTIR